MKPRSTGYAGQYHDEPCKMERDARAAAAAIKAERAYHDKKFLENRSGGAWLRRECERAARDQHLHETIEAGIARRMDAEIIEAIAGPRQQGVKYADRIMGARLGGGLCERVDDVPKARSFGRRLLCLDSCGYRFSRADVIALIVVVSALAAYAMLPDAIVTFVQHFWIR